MAKSNEEIVEEFTKPQDLIDRDGNKIGESHWSPYCIAQLRKALTQKDTEIAKAREKGEDIEQHTKVITTATVTETTGREGAKRATTKLRNSLAGCYHFLYQALRIDHSEPNQEVSK